MQPVGEAEDHLEVATVGTRAEHRGAKASLELRHDADRLVGPVKELALEPGTNGARHRQRDGFIGDAWQLRGIEGAGQGERGHDVERFSGTCGAINTRDGTVVPIGDADHVTRRPRWISRLRVPAASRSAARRGTAARSRSRCAAPR